MSFTWKNFYGEFAKKLLEYKSRRQELVEILYSALGDTLNDSGTSVVNYFKKDKDTKLTDTDPFSVFGIFNRTSNDSVRKNCIEILKKTFEIQADIPSDFDGVPLLNAQKSLFVDQDGRYIEESTSLLWNLFEKVINNEDFEQEYDEALKIKGVNNNLSMGLFWICPDRFLGLDSNNRNYIEQKLGLKISDKPNYQEYKALINKVRASHYEDFAELSMKAWKSAKNKEAETMNENKKYWLLGHAFGRNNPQYERFIFNGIWEGGFDIRKPVDQRQMSLARKIKIGDIVLLKSTATKGVNHDIPFLRIKAIGIVKSVMNEVDNGDSHLFKCEVKYLSSDEKDFEGASYGAYRQTVHEADEKVRAVIEYANSVINQNDNPMKKYSKYIELLKENHNLVLTGAPGTGKTFMAHAIAKEMGCGKDEMCFVQFHPSYDYTDFVEGLRPITDGKGGIGFERKDGVFKEFCKRALSKVQPKVHKTISKQQNSFVGTTPFEKAYRKLIFDINAGNAVLYSDFRSSMTAMKLKVENKMNFQIIKFWKTKDYQNAQYDYLKRLYNHYYSRGIYDVRNEKFDDFVKIIGNTLDYSYYRGIVQGLLDRTDKNQDVILNEHSTEQDIADVPMDEANCPYVFIIDEINRGEASKIFGELFYAIDPGYRGKTDKRVKTQYQNLIPESDVFADGFYVPDNVYIIGTMNDIDRSVESMDFAMRRRFTWKEVTPDETQSMLDSLPCADEAKKRMNRLNEEIANTDGLGAAYMVGPAYFLKLANNGGDFERLWKMNLEPLLREYLRGYGNAKDIIDKCEKAYGLTKTDEKQ